MCKAVSDCVDWNGLGLELGLKHSTLQEIEIDKRGKNSHCRRDMIATWLRNSKKDKVIKKGRPTWKQLIQALKNIGEISLSEEIEKQRKVSNPVKSTKRKSRRRDISTDEKRSVKKSKKEMKKRRKSSDTDSDNEESGETHRYKKRKIESESDSSDNEDEKEEMTRKVKRKRIESSFDSHESTNIKKRRLESSDSADSEFQYQSDYHSNHTESETHEDISYENRIIKKRSKRRKDKHVSRSKKQRMDLDERSVTSEVRGKEPAGGKPYKRKRVPKNKTDSESEDDDSDSEPSSKRR